MSAIARMMKPIADRVRLMVGRAIVSAVNDAGTLQMLQVELLADEVQDQVERFQDYGFASAPFAEAEALLVFPGGLRSHGIAIAVADRRYRLRNLVEGEVALFDDQGQVVHLKRDGILIESSLRVLIEAPEVDVTADVVNLGGVSGAAVARVGDTVNLGTGVIETGSAVVFAA